MASAYLAVDTHLNNREVALKVMTTLPGATASDRADAERLFANEMQTMSGLTDHGVGIPEI